MRKDKRNASIFIYNRRVTVRVKIYLEIMDREIGLDFHHLSLTSNQSLDNAGHFMTQLQLNSHLPEGRTTYEQIVKKLDLQPALRTEPQQRDTSGSQFVFQGQCMILGEAGVGKTSLLKSLTGKPFDPTPPKTQGIDQSLVDEEWKTLAMKDLVFGKLGWFNQYVRVQLTLFGPGKANILVRDSTIWNSSSIDLFWLCVFIIFVILNPLFIPVLVCIYLAQKSWLYFFNHNYNFRLIFYTISFAVRPRGLLIGACFASVVIGNFYNYDVIKSKLVIVVHLYILITTIVGIGFTISLILILRQNFIFGIECQWPYSGLLKFTSKFNHALRIVCNTPLIISVFVSFISCCTVVLLWDMYFFRTLGLSLKEDPKDFVYRLTVVFALFCTLELVKSAVRYGKLIRQEPWGIYKLFIIVMLSFITLSPFYFVSSHFDSTILLSFFIGDTLFNKWIDMKSLGIVGNSQIGSKLFTAVLIEKTELNNKKLKSALNKRMSSLKLKILDFAGDKEYHAYHHMFLRSQAIYIIAFNMVEFAENNVRHINARIKTLHPWVESICSHVPPNTPIFLVGTHRGDMDNSCIESINDHLKKNLWDPYCDELIVNDVDNLIFFPVENYDSQNDVGVQTLQKKIMSVVEERKKTIGHDIPLSWIGIQDAIIHLREKEEAKFCVRVEDFQKSSDNFICSNWSKETLKYFHEKGLVVFLHKDPELSKWVLLKPEILVDIIIQLVAPTQQMVQERGFRRDWKCLHDQGKLTKSLLKRIIATVQEHEEAMTAFLEEYDLICPLLNKKVKICSQRDDEEHQPTHFVPSLLPMSADGSIPVWHDDTTDKTFFVFFKRFLPEPLFHRLLSRAHKNSMLEYPNGQPVLYRDAGMFWMCPSPKYKQPYRLKLLKKEGMIEVTFSSRY